MQYCMARSLLQFAAENGPREVAKACSTSETRSRPLWNYTASFLLGSVKTRTEPAREASKANLRLRWDLRSVSAPHDLASHSKPRHT